MVFLMLWQLYIRVTKVPGGSTDDILPDPRPLRAPGIFSPGGHGFLFKKRQ